ncbi:MAG: hypothetical protein WEA04_04870 [Candidatus Andersenbacteria bacterium]
MPSKSKSFLIRLLPRFNTFGAFIFAWLGTAIMRLLVIFIGVLLLAYMLYLNVWQPLRQEVELPPGVTPTNPELDVTRLKEINNQRSQRFQSIRRNFETRNFLFVPQQTSGTP